MKSVPTKNRDIIWQFLKGEAVLLNPIDGSYFGLNSVGSSFWEKVDGKKTIEEILDLLLQEYMVERDVLVRDIEEFVHSMEDKGLISLK
ncbi:conserved hypothetical protein [Desulfofarcimen acetoxidans DSM 771]|uniref:Coenzyme PQQ synthesis D n=1 Tax=Desulfofarcimen acetoxidans (strain ATCC 49208 / DSM 771 / KCTC 5769 / VKM B-1644 / 5575) TaxID=485916 RepID=C8VWA1_DESAS|nr:PqqD family protein [Desulfofarcimen acetoxidans]ACV62453.1 conserved hypothetical protein [Desulfofarcimen acetoxidans DSM 771]